MPFQLHCATCGKTFSARKSKEVYCTKLCYRRARSKPQVLGDILKARTLGLINSRGLTMEAAAREIGITGGTLRSWLSQPGTRLRLENLEPLATWLGIDKDTAISLQGGTVEDRLRVHILSQPGGVEHRRRFSSDRAYRKKIRDKAISAIRGKPFSEDHRQRISAALKAYRQQPDAHPLGENKKTLRGQACTVLTTVRRTNPTLDRQQAVLLTAKRLLAPPWNICDETAARMLLLTNKEIQDAARAIRAQRRRPPDERRHRLIEEVRAQWLHTHPSFRGVWPACVAALEAAGYTLPGDDPQEKAEKLERSYDQHRDNGCILLDRITSKETNNSDRADHMLVEKTA